MQKPMASEIGSFLCASASLRFISVSFAFLMTDHVDDYGAGQNQHMVFTVGDVHAVGVGPREPAFADTGHGAPAALESVFVIEKTALRLRIIRPRHIHSELASQECEQMLFHDGDKAAVEFDFISRSPREEFLPNERQFI